MDHKDQIANLAYEIYLKSGRIEGRDLDNWLEAERLLLSRNKQNAPVAELRREQPQKPTVAMSAARPNAPVFKPGKKGRREKA